MMKHAACFIFLILHVITGTVNANGYYTIVAPGTIQSDYAYDVTVTLHEHHVPATISVAISGPSYNATQTIEVNPSSAEIVHFDVPTLESGDYELETEGLKGLIFKQRTKLTYKNELPKVYIQTDKAKYKPGDVVQYRILALDENLKPSKANHFLTLGIQDGASNKIRQISNVTFEKGVHSGKFQLSEQPVLGEWTIEITQGKDHKSKATKKFEVAKYVLPKFTVEMESDQKVAVLDKVVKITVRSKYTYGKPVKGKATVKASIDGTEHYQLHAPPVHNVGIGWGSQPATYIPHQSFSPASRQLGATKTVDIDGKGEVEFDLIDDLKIDQHNGYTLPEIHVVAVVTEGFTGLEQNTTSTISVVSSRFTITVPKMASSYEPNKPFEIKAIIKKLNGSPVTNARSTAKLFIGKQQGGRYYGAPNSHELMFEGDVNSLGVATFKVKLSAPAFYNSMKIMYEEHQQNFPGFRVGEDQQPQPQLTGHIHNRYYPVEHIGPLKLFPKTRDGKIGEEIEIDVKSEDRLPYFVYTVMVRGKILKHEYVKVDGDKKCVCIKIKPTLDMGPKAKIFVYFVKNGEFKHDETTINIPNSFGNQLQISAPEQAKPGDMVTLNIQADPESYVGLLGVDQSVLLLETGNDFDDKQILRDLESYDSHTNWNQHNPSNPGGNSGFVTITNACKPHQDYGYRPMVMGGQPGVYAAPSYGLAGMPGMPVQGAGISFAASAERGPYPQQMPMPTPVAPIQPKIRKDFVESWIFDSIESTDANGTAQFTKKIPDTITSWVITGFSLSDHSGFGLTENTTKIRVFQPFFLSTNLPYSIKRGEVVTIPVTIFNYMETDLDAEITMENEYREFDFTEALTDDMEVAFDDKQRTKKVIVPANDGETVSFTIRANIVGEITLMIKAITSVAGDAIHQKLKVISEGVTQFKNKALFISIPSTGTVTHTLKANIPSNAILDSEYLEFSAIGDILGPTIKNIDQLVRMPYGCGEQNMVNFVPNILVLDYLTVIKADLPPVVEKAKNYMEKGYQRQMTYKHEDGAFSAFGEGSSESNSWLTAYVARSFIQAQKYMTISDTVIDEAIEYLISTQKPNGQFPQTGKMLDSTDQGEVGVSAYIMLALLEDEEYALKYKTEIEKGLNYLIENVVREDDAYTLSLVALVFQKVKHPDLNKLVEKLKLKSNTENNLKWWGKASKSYRNNNIEITAYALQTLVETEEAGDILPIIKWLIGQRNSLGGFDSTQDTVVGLQALIKFGEKFLAGGSGSLSISFEAHDSDGTETTKDMFEINEHNSLVLQGYVLPKPSRQLTLTASGQGSALVQLSYRYNTADEDDKPSFAIQHTLKPSQYSGQLLLHVCAEYKPLTSDAPSKESNMAVMEINLPSGYTADDDSLDMMRKDIQIQRVETKNSDTTIVVYFDSLVVGQPICLDVAGERSHAVAKLKSAAITIYDYYNTEERATVYYEMKSSLCDICDKEECGKGCKQQ